MTSWDSLVADAFIFDLDGTLVDSMPLHYMAWNQAFNAAGLDRDLDQELFYSLGGVPSPEVARIIAQHYQLEADLAALFIHKEKLFLEKKRSIKVIDSVATFARKISSTHPIAIASGGPRDVVEETLQIVGLRSLFHVVVTASDVTHGKPAPDMFLLAAERMSVEPSRCIVFEDAQPGIEAAKAAKMRYIHIRSREFTA